MRIFRSARVEKGFRTAAILLAVILGYLLLRTIPPVSRVFGYVEHALVTVGTGVGGIISRITTPENSLQARYAQCEDRVRDIAVREAALADADRRVAELEALLQYTADAGVQGTVARIIARSLPESATVRIDKGSNDGIAIGNAVVIDDGHLLGAVIDVRAASSDVRLVHSTQSRIPSRIVGHSRTIGNVEGQGGSLLHMMYIPQDEIIEEGNIVVTSGLEGEVPANLVIGVVTSVIREETAPFLEALIEPLYDPREWTTVLVLPAPSL